MAKQHDPHGTYKLTLASFHRLFPQYPLDLFAFRISAKACRRLTVPEFFLDFDQTVFARAVSHALLHDARTAQLDGEQLTPDALWDRFVRTPSGLALKWPRVPLEEQFVVRSWLWYPENVEGPHFIWSGNGFKLILEPLWMTLGAVDDKLDPEQRWKEAALYEDCLQPAEPRRNDSERTRVPQT
jgi:hypothetical protein